MSIETFSRQQFEEVLTSISPYEPQGVVKGEYCYVLPLDPKVGVYVRSSVNQFGWSNPTGEDSIRLYLVQKATCPNQDFHEFSTASTHRRQPRESCSICHDTGYTWEFWPGAKPDAYTQRTSGWCVRLGEKVAWLRNLRVRAGDCRICGLPKRIAVSHSANNPGRLYARCKNHEMQGFIWLS